MEVMDCEEGNLLSCPKIGLPFHLNVPQKTGTKPLRCKRRLTFDDESLIAKRCRGNDDFGLAVTIVGGKDFPEIQQSLNLQTGITLSASLIICGLPALLGIVKEEKADERHEPTLGNGTLKNTKCDEPQVLHLHSSLLQPPNVGSASEHTGNGDSEGKCVAEEVNVDKSVVVGPPTPLPARRKRRKFGTKLQKLNLAEVSVLAANSPYYTRSINVQVLNAIKLMEGKAVSCKGSGRQLKARSFSHKDKKKPSVESTWVASGAWQELMKKATAESCGTLLENGESISVESESLIFNGKVESFISKVGTIQGQRIYLPWKGSVLDSVIGALLTQRTGDNFSSSAFMSLGVSFPQDRDCDRYSRNHRMMRCQRSNCDRSCQNQDEDGSKMILGAEGRVHFDENKKETLIKRKVARKKILKPDWNTWRTQFSGNMDIERSKDAICS